MYRIEAIYTHNALEIEGAEFQFEELRMIRETIEMLNCVDVSDRETRGYTHEDRTFHVKHFILILVDIQTRIDDLGKMIECTIEQMYATLNAPEYHIENELMNNQLEVYNYMIRDFENQQNNLKTNGSKIYKIASKIEKIEKKLNK
tara:strand:+ start:1183 stop:1620 length:438 start_codon:yes stop_codon:yes gene_type:complete